MHINICPFNGNVIIDDELHVVDLSSMDQSIQGMHWEGTSGEICYWDKETKKIIRNEEITDFTPYQYIVDLFLAEKAKADEKETKRKEDLVLPMALSRRGSLLSGSDWTQLPDVPLTTEQKAAWEVYRQFLRDVPSQPGFPHTIDWGTPPQ